jgi:hypothetical protein
MSLAAWDDTLRREKIRTALERAMRWSLFDFHDKSRLAKVLVPVPPHGSTTRAEAAWALGQHFAYDGGGLARRRAGVAITLSPADSQRYRDLLRGVEVFVNPGVADLALDVKPTGDSGVRRPTPVPEKDIPLAGPPHPGPWGAISGAHLGGTGCPQRQYGEECDGDFDCVDRGKLKRRKSTAPGLESWGRTWTRR